ncbi:MAG: hypothetical protein A3J62_02860 [Candidatus Buchananbacteria bacterium RIFCSPHIGHO2_02_FULL_38_8]|nr:MAG: hypothetical protein A3J62_02860 [Candidatus Buchananbacteria bacterium RIFCSPHIGHO2_02_FULL_38_8]
MEITSDNLINLPVYTQSGQYLGRVTSFEIDVDSYAIIYYHVRTGLIKGLWHQELLISQSQVISVSKEKMVVDDNVGKQPEADWEKIKLVTPAAE